MTVREQFTEEQTASLLEDYFNHRPSTCPLCEEGKIEAEETSAIGYPKSQVLVHCPSCRAQGERLPGMSDEPPWNDEEKGRIEAAYGRSRFAHCPTDGWAMRISPSGELRRPKLIRGWCSRCGRGHEWFD